MFHQEVRVNEKHKGVTTFKTIEEDEAYTTSSLGKLINQVFTKLKTIASDFLSL
jgi:hypothetical protein